MIHKTSTFKFTSNYIGNYRLGPGEQVTIDAHFPSLSKDIIIKADLFIRNESNSGFSDPHNIKLYQKNADNSLTLVDVGENRDSNHPYCVAFNVAKYLFLKKNNITTLVLKNETSSYLYFSTTENSCYEIDYVSSKSLSLDKTNFSYSFSKDYSISINPITQNHHIVKSLFDGLLPYNVSINYSNNNRHVFGLMNTLSWKISIIDFLIMNYDNDQNLASIDYFDKNNDVHPFIQIDNTPYFHSIDGSGLLLERKEIDSVVTYELFNELTTAKKIFNYFGRLTSIVDENGRTTTISYSSNAFDATITYVDPNGNEIVISNDSVNSIMTICLNDDLEHLIYYNLSQNKIYQIDDDEIVYDIDEKITSISTTSDEELLLSYDDGLLDKIEIQKDDCLIDQTSFEYDYLLFKTISRTGVTITYYYNEELEVVMSGEMLDEDNSPIVQSKSKNLLVEDIYASLNNPNGIAYYINLDPYYHCQIDYESAFSDFDDIGSGLYLSGKRKLLLFIGIEKITDVPFNENRNVKIRVVRKYLYPDEEVIATLDFNPHLHKQYASIVFEYDPIHPITEYSIVICPTGLYHFGGINVFNPLVLELDNERKVTYYANLDSSINNDIVFEMTGESLEEDELDWQQFLTAEDTDSNNNVIATFSYNDLVRNYIGVEKNSHFYWSDDFKSCKYNSSLPSSSNGGYPLRRHRNIQSHNTLFGKKTFIKRYKDSNNNEKEIYDFEYLSRNNNGEFVLTTIHHVGDEVYKTIKKYNSNFKLVEETSYDGIVTRYEYDANNNLVKSESGIVDSSGNFTGGRFRTNYSYDAKRRLTSTSSLVANLIETKSFTYVDNYEIQNTIIDESNEALNYFHNFDYSYIFKIQKSSSTINRNYSNLYNYFVYNDSKFVYVDSIIDSNQTNTFSIVNLSNSSPLYTETSIKTYSNNEIVIYKGNGTYNTRIRINKYNNPYVFSNSTSSSPTGGTFLPYFYNYYFSEYDENTIVSANGAQDQTAVSFKCKLYKTRDRVGYRQNIYNYDSDNNIVLEKIIDTETTPNDISATEYTYDFLNRLETKSNNYDLYQFNSLITYLDFMSNVVTKTQISSTSLNKIISYSTNYDSLKRKNYSSSTYGTGLEHTHKTSFVYYSKEITEDNESINLASRLIKRVDYSKPKNVSIIGRPIYVLSYDCSDHVEFDAKGNVSSLTRTNSTTAPSSSQKHEYMYDSNNRLVIDRVSISDISSYSYDDNGNIVSKTMSGTTINYTYGNSSYKDLLTAYNGIAISYDACLNPISYGSNISYSWNKFNHLESYSDSSNSTSYFYTYQGIRTKKILHDGTIHEYILEGKRIIAEKITSNNTSKYIHYLYSQDGIFGMYYNNIYYYFRKNILGDITEIYNGETLIARYSYTAYGETKVFNGSGVDITNDSTQINHIGRINPFRYRGYYYDEESGMYYCNARYYVPEWCRWLSKDESEYLDPNTIDGINLFAYCLNNPIMYRDENGHVIVSLLIGGFFFGFLLSGATSIISQLVTGDHTINWWQVLFDSSIGGIGGLISMSGIGLAGSVILGGLLNMAGSIGGDLIESGWSSNSINWTKAGFMLFAGLITGGMCGEGVQNVDSLADSIVAAISNSSGIKALKTVVRNGGSQAAFNRVLRLFSKKIANSISTAFAQEIINGTFTTVFYTCLLLGFNLVVALFEDKY